MIAVFNDGYGRQAVKLMSRKSRRGGAKVTLWTWEGRNLSGCGYRPVLSEARALANARRDRRFTDIREG